MLVVRLGRVDSVENPDNDDGVGIVRLSQIGSIQANDEDGDGAGMVSVGCHLAIWVALSVSCVAVSCSWLS